MPDYEILVAGPIGPAVASSLPGFTITTRPHSTVLSGTVADPDELLAVTNLLASPRLSPIDTMITAHDRVDHPVQPAEQAHQQRSPGTP